jgi:pyruvate decarboxylase
MIDDALYTALSLKKPVYLEIPVNLSTYSIDAPVPITDPRQLASVATPLSDPATLELVLEDISRGIENAVKPVLLAGSKLRKTSTEERFQRLAEAMGCATGIMPDAKGLVNEESSLYMGRYWGTVSSDHVEEVVESSDLIILAGPIINDYTTVGWSTLLPQNKLLILGPNYVNFAGHYYPNVQLADVMDGLIDRVQVKNGSLQAYERYKEQAGEQVPTQFSGSDSLSLRYIQQTIQQSLTSNTTLVVETGDSWFIGQSFKLPEGCKYHVQMQYGSIGWSVGALLGIALAEGSDRRVLALIGDGSFQLTAQEVSTMIRYKVKATILLLNNDGYTIEVQIHDGTYNDIKMWDYAKLIEVFNNTDGYGIGVKAHTNEEFVEALKKSEEHDGITLIECFLGRDDCTKALLEWGTRVAKANGRRNV